MTAEDNQLLGQWRVIKMEFWDAACINLVGPGFIRWTPPITLRTAMAVVTMSACTA
jgi:hypothetical protein